MSVSTPKMFASLQFFTCFTLFYTVGSTRKLLIFAPLLLLLFKLLIPLNKLSLFLSWDLKPNTTNRAAFSWMRWTLLNSGELNIHSRNNKTHENTPRMLGCSIPLSSPSIVPSCSIHRSVPGLFPTEPARQFPLSSTVSARFNMFQLPLQQASRNFNKPAVPGRLGTWPAVPGNVVKAALRSLRLDDIHMTSTWHAQLTWHASGCVRLGTYHVACRDWITTRKVQSSPRAQRSSTWN